jgi:hypothetical protein
MTVDLEIVEVKQVSLTSNCNPAHVNDLLQRGWRILTVAPQPGTQEIDAMAVYSLGRPKAVAS